MGTCPLARLSLLSIMIKNGLGSTRRYHLLFFLLKTKIGESAVEAKIGESAVEGILLLDMCSVLQKMLWYAFKRVILGYTCYACFDSWHIHSTGIACFETSRSWPTGSLRSIFCVHCLCSEGNKMNWWNVSISSTMKRWTIQSIQTLFIFIESFIDYINIPKNLHIIICLL